MPSSAAGASLRIPDTALGGQLQNHRLRVHTSPAPTILCARPCGVQPDASTVAMISTIRFGGTRQIKSSELALRQAVNLRCACLRILSHVLDLAAHAETKMVSGGKRWSRLLTGIAERRRGSRTERRALKAFEGATRSITLLPTVRLIASRDASLAPTSCRIHD